VNWYKVQLDMQSASGTLWQADTIFGHLCWALRYLEGEKALSDFLDWYENGMAPLLVSNGFPGGRHPDTSGHQRVNGPGDMLPNPILPPVPVPASLPLAGQLEHFRQVKEAKKVGYLTREDFDSVLRGRGFDPEPYKSKKPETSTRTTLKNQINRLTGTTGEGGELFPFEEHFWETVTIYLKIESGFEDKVKKLFEYLKDVGYGKRKSVGYGQIKKLDFKAFDGFATPPDANGFVSLSNFVPAENDPTNGSWRVLVKYGKLSEGYAADQNVFKKPLFMLEAGSTFYSSPIKDYYGQMVKELAKDHDEVVQYGYALPVAMKLPGKRVT